jgi:hypothetical protein
VGGKDRITPVPAKVVEPLRAHLEMVREQHGADLAQGAGSVELPSPAQPNISPVLYTLH